MDTNALMIGIYFDIPPQIYVILTTERDVIVDIQQIYQVE